MTTTVRAVVYAIGFLLVLVSAVYFGIRAIGGLQEIAEQPTEDDYYEANGCYISDGGSMYTCPNGAPSDPDANPEVLK
jgi:hypothetical protein